MSKKKASEPVVAVEKPLSAQASEKAIPLPKKNESSKDSGKEKPTSSSKKTKSLESPSLPASPPPEQQPNDKKSKKKDSNKNEKKSNEDDHLETPFKSNQLHSSSYSNHVEESIKEGNDKKSDKKDASAKSSESSHSNGLYTNNTTEETSSSKEKEKAKPTLAPKTPEPIVESSKSPKLKEKTDKKAAAGDAKKPIDTKSVSPPPPIEESKSSKSKSSKSMSPSNTSETLPSIKQKDEKKESKSVAPPVSLPSINSSSRATTPAPNKKTKVEKPKEAAKSPKSSAPPSRKSSAKPVPPAAKSPKASSSSKKSEVKKTVSKASKPNTASSEKSPRTPKPPKKEKVSSKNDDDTAKTLVKGGKEPSFKSLEKANLDSANKDAKVAPTKRPDTSKAKAGKKKKSHIPILKQKKSLKQAALIESINSNIRTLSNFLNGNTDILLKGRVSSTGELIPADIPDDLTELSRADLEKNYMILKNTVTDLEKQVAKERSRTRLLPKTTTSVPTSLEANIHLRYQYQKALDQERENYNKLQKENQKLVAQMKVLEMKQFKYKKAQSIEEQTAHITEMNILRNKIKEVESEYDRSIEEHAKTKVTLLKEIKEKERIANEMVMMRRLQMHLSNQLAGRWGIEGAESAAPSSPYSNESGSLPSTRNQSAKSVRIVENGKVTKPSHKMENSRLVKPTAASAGRVAALEEKRAAKLKELRKSRKRISSKASSKSSKSSNPSTAPTSEEDENRNETEEDYEDSHAEDDDAQTQDNDEDQEQSEALTRASDTEEDGNESEQLEAPRKTSHSKKK